MFGTFAAIVLLSAVAAIPAQGEDISGEIKCVEKGAVAFVGGH